MSRPFMLSEPAGGSIARLIAIAEELREIASETEGSRPPRPCACPPERIARAVYAMRRKREALFGVPGLFGEPAWDMLLDLYLADFDGKRLSVTGACIGSAVPVTTALRWLDRLDEAGLITREGDARDGRRTHVQITPLARQAMDACLGQFADLLNNAAGGAAGDQPANRPKAAAPA